MIPPGSCYEQIIADFLEEGLGLPEARYFVNQLLVEDGKEPVGLSTIRNTALRLKPKEIRVRTIPQGNQCAHSTWAKASFALCKQLAIRFGVLDPLKPDPPMSPPLKFNNADALGASLTNVA